MVLPWKNLMSARIQDREIRKFLDAIDDRVTVLENVYKVTVVTGTTFTAGENGTILVDDTAAGGPVTINLPPVAGHTTPYYVKKIGSTANVTVDADGSEMIDNSLTAVIGVQYDAIRLAPGSGAWWIT